MSKKRINRRLFALLACWLACSTAARAEVGLNRIFTDSMVLQREMMVPIYGTADDGERVVVAFAGQKTETTATNGAWLVRLRPLEAGGPHVLRVRGKNSIELRDVLVGDVWICSGQSNMHRTLSRFENHKPEIPRALNPNIRILWIASQSAAEPQKDFKIEPRYKNAWRPCTPQFAQHFSAVGYFFGKYLQPAVGIPLGLIQSTVGGTSARAWTPPDVVARDEFKHLIRSWQGWQKTAQRKTARCEKDLAEGGAKAKAARKELARIQRLNNHRLPSGLYNAMIHPLQPFAIKGVVWYQGYSDAHNFREGLRYRTLFPAMISGWRRAWGQGDFPFLFVQLPAYGKPQETPVNEPWAWTREAQQMALALPNTGMAAIVDAGERGAHPQNKAIVGERLALVARNKVYGQDLVCSGPRFDGMQVEGRRARIRFTHVGSGLVAKAVTIGRHEVGGETLKGFAICGEDRKFVWAEATIEGDTVVLSAQGIEKPVAIRYAWANFPLCNLYNTEGLPAVPFRTDRFDPVPRP